MALGDWNDVGQRLTDSGVEFHDTGVVGAEILGPDPLTGRTFTPSSPGIGSWSSSTSTLGPPKARWRRRSTGRACTRCRGRPRERTARPTTPALHPAERGEGRCAAKIRTAALLADRAGDALQAALDTGPSLTAEQRAEAAVAVYEVK
ncbi:hypothetical protein ABZ801_35295 [Actinomadura sp. NPDC047616]|uniref:hypothetical protein n=1 Tax=Actinomadura sp. NPDC047616 TaxID=3155914 RepID=UPI0033CF6B99